MNYKSIFTCLYLMVSLSVFSQKTEQLHEIIIRKTGAIDLAIERKTPVAVSNIEEKEIQENLSNNEFVEILNKTPSVYTTRMSGGFGDSRLSLRGFDQTNTMFLLNSIPLNDIQGGWVYWSNTLGIYDVAKKVQIQRGMGASRLAIPSVGGTINIITKQAGERNEGFFKSTFGNDGYFKSAIAYDTPINKKGWSSSFYLNKWQGDGFANNTQGSGVGYLFSVGYQPSTKLKINATVIGAGQWHNRRANAISLNSYLQYKGNDIRKYNGDWGFLNGDEYALNKNFYQKPMASISSNYQINTRLKWTSTLYGAWGRGGETFADGDINSFRNSNGIIDVDAIVASNTSSTPYTGSNTHFTGQLIGNDGVNNNVITRNAYVNAHNGYGLFSNLTYNLKNWTVALGIDLRNHKGINYAAFNDFLGLNGVQTNTPVYNNANAIYTQTVEANPYKSLNRDSAQKIFYHNIANVNIGGVNTLIEYEYKNKLSSVLQLGISKQSYQRIDYMYQAQNPESETKTIGGGYIKGGVNYNLNNYHSIFVNAGKIYRQPSFYNVFLNFGNKVNNDITTEKITSFEMGYNLHTSKVKVSFNAYHTLWTDRFLSKNISLPSGNGKAQFQNLKEIHTGLELETAYKPIKKLTLSAMASIGNWRYGNQVKATVFDDTQTQIGTSTLYLKDVKVGNAAQTTVNFNTNYQLFKNTYIDLNWQQFSNLYAELSVLDDAFLQENNQGALALPNYQLFDFKIKQQLKINKQHFTILASVNNVFDTTYIAESSSNIHTNSTTTNTYKGLDTNNTVWFGVGRTWTFSLKYMF